MTCMLCLPAWPFQSQAQSRSSGGAGPSSQPYPTSSGSGLDARLAAARARAAESQRIATAGQQRGQALQRHLSADEPAVPGMPSIQRPPVATSQQQPGSLIVRLPNPQAQQARSAASSRMATSQVTSSSRPAVNPLRPRQGYDPSDRWQRQQGLGQHTQQQRSYSAADPRLTSSPASALPAGPPGLQPDGAWAASSAYIGSPPLPMPSVPWQQQQGSPFAPLQGLTAPAYGSPGTMQPAMPWEAPWPRLSTGALQPGLQVRGHS